MVDMGFQMYKLVYPYVPRQSPQNMYVFLFFLYAHYLVFLVLIFVNLFFILCGCDLGVYVMMFLEYWKSPHTSLFTLFKESDVPNLRIKIANELVFSPKNSGRKDLVTSYQFVE
jgi:hypothetical protein